MPYNINALKEGEVLSSFTDYLFAQNTQMGVLIRANFQIISELLREYGGKCIDDSASLLSIKEAHTFCKPIWWTTSFDRTGTQPGLCLEICILPIGDDSTAVYICHRIVHPLLPLFRNRLYLIESILVNYMVSIKHRAEVIEGMTD
jgi:hypothetical protein